MSTITEGVYAVSGPAVDRARVALFATSHAIDDMYQGAVPALLPFFVADRHYSYAAAAGLMFALTAMSSVIQPVFGALTDRLHLFWLVPAGLTVAGVGVGLSGLTQSYLLTFLAIAVAGVGVAAFHPEAARAARAASVDSQQAMSVFSVGGNVGYAIGPMFVFAVLFFVPGTGGTVFLAVPALITGAVVFVVLRRHPETHVVRHLSGQRPQQSDDWRGFIGLTSVVMLRSIVYFGLTSLVALYVGTSLHGGKGLGEAALTTMVGFGAVGTITGGRLADRFGRLPVTRVSFVASIVSLLAVALTPLPWVFLPIAVTGFVLFQSFSLTVTLGQDYLPTRIGTSSGVTLGLAISVGGLVAPGLGALADATSLRVSLLVLLAFLPAGLAIALRLRDPRPPRRQSSERPGVAAPSAPPAPVLHVP
jgi:FSR family fosmidomycin resistance protein-like MFS transporter